MRDKGQMLSCWLETLLECLNKLASIFLKKTQNSKWIVNRRTDASLISLLPVDFGWEIITMVNEDLGSQLLLIPDHSHSPLFWHIIPWKNMKSQCSAALWFLYEPQPSHPFPSALSLPAPFPPLPPNPTNCEGLSRPSRPIVPPTAGALLLSALWNDLLQSVSLGNSWKSHALRSSWWPATSSDRGEAIACRLPILHPLSK